eukprot:3299885-Prymnesium_polylepis.1
MPAIGSAHSSTKLMARTMPHDRLMHRTVEKGTGGAFATAAGFRPAATHMGCTQQHKTAATARGAVSFSRCRPVKPATTRLPRSAVPGRAPQWYNRSLGSG